MAKLAIGMHYLTGYAVATDPGDRDRAEWPPHPARVFMALAAAHFETGDDPAEAAALQWLETLPAPALALPEVDEQAQQRTMVTVYVPVNDKAGPAAATLQCAPALTRSKQPRTFPKVWVGDEPCYLIWPKVADDELAKHHAALAGLCGKVTRVGHSSSLVRMWIAPAGEAREPNHQPDAVTGSVYLRQVSAGSLDYLARQFNRKESNAFIELDAAIRNTTGKAQQEAKARFKQRFDTKWKHSLTPPPALRPTVSLAAAYRRISPSTATAQASSCFDANLLVLNKEVGPTRGLESTLTLTAALRGAIMRACPEQPPPEWISGHATNGGASALDHLALLPLPYVTAEHADGHVLGLAMAFPRQVTALQRGEALRSLLTNPDGTPANIRLTLGRLGVWILERASTTRPAIALRVGTWTAASTTWASVTPVVLDRFPKMDRRKDRVGWTAEVCGIVAAACERIGLPEPTTIDIGTSSWHRGSPRAVPKRRTLHHGEATREGATLGGGFPMLPAKSTRPVRPQVHVYMRFDRPVQGPVLLGAGRYLGYGLCKPLREQGGDVWTR